MAMTVQIARTLVYLSIYNPSINIRMLQLNQNKILKRANNFAIALFS